MDTSVVEVLKLAEDMLEKEILTKMKKYVRDDQIGMDTVRALLNDTRKLINVTTDIVKHLNAVDESPKSILEISPSKGKLNGREYTIYALYQTGRYTMKELGEMFYISQTSVSRILDQVAKEIPVNNAKSVVINRKMAKVKGDI